MHRKHRTARDIAPPNMGQTVTSHFHYLVASLYLTDMSSRAMCHADPALDGAIGARWNGAEFLLVTLRAVTAIAIEG